LGTGESRGEGTGVKNGETANRKSGFRAGVLHLLRSPNVEEALDALYRLPSRKVLRLLLSSIGAEDDTLRWRAIQALGRIVARLGDEDTDAARTIIRRLMWTLNDESGGIGWGAPEVMAEAMAQHAGLADEFAHILISYINPDGNYLRYVPLQRGVVWGIRRMAEVEPSRVQAAQPLLEKLLESEDVQLKELVGSALKVLKGR